MAPFSGFLGGSYSGLAMAADAERSVNLFPERIESPGGQTKSSSVLLSKPGLKAFTTLAGATSVQAECEINGRGFAVAGGFFWEVNADGTNTKYGTVAAGRAQIVASQSQVLILAGGNGYNFTLATNAFTQITASGFPANAAKCGISDAYFIVLQGGTQNFFISALNDGTQWDPLDYGNAQGEAGNLVSFVVDHRQLYLLASTHFEVYYDSGNANFPWSRLEGAFGEMGCEAVDSPAKVDNTLFWLGGNRDGGGMVWRANGYTPQRISTHAVEAAIQSYPTRTDASGYCYQENGHTFYRLDFPSANGGLGATWLYDVASGFWHERTYLSNGIEQADLARTHMYCFGKHLVGDYQSGILYEQSTKYATDNGAPIRRMRIAPDLADGGRWRFYQEFRLFMQVGMGLDGTGQGTNPVSTLQTSDDGGFTWGSERTKSMGKLGQYKVLVRWRCLGRSMNRAFRWVCTEPIFVALIAADLDSHG